MGFATAGMGGRRPSSHAALLYRGDQEYVAGVVRFIEEGLACGQPVAAAVPGSRLDLLRDALGDDGAGRVELTDMVDAGRNPARIIALLWEFADAHPDASVRMIGEALWPGRTPAEYPACVQHEALVNAAFEGRGATMLCPYDVDRFPDAVCDVAATHPRVWESGQWRYSDEYAPGHVLERYNEPLFAGRGAVTRTVTTAADLSHARRFAIQHGKRLGLASDRVDDLELITTELVTNSMVHTDGGCQLRLWRADGRLVCGVSDTGRLPHLLVGRRQPPLHQFGGRGLLLVNDLADLVRIHTTPYGTTIHAHLNLG